MKGRIVFDRTNYLYHEPGSKRRDKFDGLASENSLTGTLLSDLAVSLKPCLPWISLFTPVPTLGTKPLNHRPLGTSKLFYISPYMLPSTGIYY